MKNFDINVNEFKLPNNSVNNDENITNIENNKTNINWDRKSSHLTNFFGEKVIKTNSNKYLVEIEKIKKDKIVEQVKEIKDKRMKKIHLKLHSITENKYKTYIKYTDFLVGFLTLTNVVFQLVQNNRYTSAISIYVDCNDLDKYNITTSCLGVYPVITKNEYTLDDVVISIRWIIIAIIILLESLVILRYSLKTSLLKAQNVACKKDNIITTGYTSRFLSEILVLLIMTPPYVVGIFSGRMLNGVYSYSYDSIITFFSLIKLVYLIRVYSHLAIWTSDDIVQIGLENKVSINARFALKAELKNKPYIMIFIIFMISMGIFGFLMRIFEFGYSNDANLVVGSKSVNPNFKTFTDTFWVVIITMMTVGYGDIYPSTHFGRVIAFLSAIVGMLIVSILIITLSNFTEFSPAENKAHNLVKKKEANNQSKHLAANLIAAVGKLYLIKVSDYYLYDKPGNKRHSMYFQQFMYAREIASEFMKFKKIASIQSIPSDEILSRLEKKLHLDVYALASENLILHEITDQTKRIIENEKEINSAVNYLKSRQDEFAEFLVKINNLNINK